MKVRSCIDRLPGRVSMRISGMGRSRLRRHKFDYLLSQQPGIEEAKLLGTLLTVRFDPSLTDKARIKSFIEGLTVSRLSAVTVPPKPFPTVDMFHMDEYPKENLAFSLLTFILTLYGGLSVTTLNVLLAITSLPIYRRAIEAMVKDRKLSVDFLDALAHLTAQLQQNFSAVAFMSVILNVGDLIRDKTSEEAERTISSLLSFEKDEAWVLRNTKKVRILVSEIEIGDAVIIYPGHMIPVDGEVISGEAALDQKSLTGESLPATKSKGNKVYAGTMVLEGVLQIRAERVGGETSVARIVKIVTEGAKSSTAIEDYARKFGDHLVVPALGISGAVYAATRDLSRFTSMVIVDFGTGMRVSAPTAVLSSMIMAARSGVLIKGGQSIEKMNQADTLVFDKTGTLTQGKPRVHDIISLDRQFSQEDLIRWAAMAESKFSHPVASAVLQKAEYMEISIPEIPVEPKYRIGYGVEALLDGQTVHLGSESFMSKNDIDISQAKQRVDSFYSAGRSVLLLAVNSRLVGLLTYSDILREEAVDVIRNLRSNGIKHVVMLTGDNQRVAATIAEQLGIDEFVAEATPDRKLEYIRILQKKGQTVVAVGDGINDTPALTVADVGITVKNGVELAKESADVVLMEENLWKIVEAFGFAHKGISLIEQNRNILYVVNAGVFVSAAFGILSPVVSSAISDGASVLATLNSVKPFLLDSQAKTEKSLGNEPVAQVSHLPVTAELQALA